MNYKALERKLARLSRQALREIEMREAAARAVARPRRLSASRMYQAAKASRLTNDWTSSTIASADYEIRSSLTNLRGRSRALERDSSYAKRAKRIVVNNVIGTGMGLQAQVKNTRGEFAPRFNDAIEAAWKAWTRADSCHTGGELSFADIERFAMGQTFDAGEIFIRLHFQAFGTSSDVPLALELIESERVPHEIMPPVSMIGTGNYVRMGVEIEPRFCRPVAYWVRRAHPGDGMFTVQVGQDQYDRVPADEMIHLRIIERWPQTRGVPWLHTAARKLNDMDGYSEAEIVAARGAANYLASVEQSDPDDPDIDEQDDGSRELELEPGIVLTPKPGQKLNFFAPNRPNAALDPFMRYMLREIAAGVGVSYESISRDYSQSNYSSSRLALLDDRDTWRELQAWFVRVVRERIHSVFMRQAVLANAVFGLSAETFFADRMRYEAARYKPRGWSWIDPTKEVAAYKEAVKAGFVTTSQVISQTGSGYDFEDLLDERQQELELQDEKGLSFDTDPGAASTSSASPPASDSEPDPNDATDPSEPASEEQQTARQMRLVQ